MTVEEILTEISGKLTIVINQLTDMQSSINTLSSISTSIDSAMAFVFQISIVAGITALAYWKNQTALYGVAVLAMILIGWQWELPLMIPIMILALYTGYRAIRPYLPW